MGVNSKPHCSKPKMHVKVDPAQCLFVHLV